MLQDVIDSILQWQPSLVPSSEPRPGSSLTSMKSYRGFSMVRVFVRCQPNRPEAAYFWTLRISIRRYRVRKFVWVIHYVLKSCWGDGIGTKRASKQLTVGSFAISSVADGEKGGRKHRRVEQSWKASFLSSEWPGEAFSIVAHPPSTCHCSVVLLIAGIERCSRVFSVVIWIWC